MSLVRLDTVQKSYAGAEVLRGVDFWVERGERIGLIGRNGTGKSTIFRLLMGEIEPESGKVSQPNSQGLHLYPRMMQKRHSSLSTTGGIPSSTIILRSSIRLSIHAGRCGAPTRHLSSVRLRPFMGPNSATSFRDTRVPLLLRTAPR